MIRRSTIHLLVVGVLCAFPDATEAACAAQVQGLPTQFATVTDALNAAHAVSHRNHTIAVSGVCTENIAIRDFENLRIEGAPDTEIRAAVAGQAVITIEFSRNVELRNLTIKGSSNAGVSVNGSSPVFIHTSVMEENRDGLTVGPLSLATLRDSVVRGNTRNGVSVGGGTLSLRGAIEVRDNARIGIVVSAGSALDANCAAGTPCRITDNDVGGVRSSGVAQLTNILVQRNSRLFVDNDLKDEIIVPGAVSSSNGGFLSLNSSTVSENFSDGVTAFQNASVAISASTVEHNAGDGVLVDRVSTLNLTTGDSILMDNGGRDLRCRNGSFTAVLEGTIIGTEQCNGLLKQRLDDLPPFAR